MEAPPSRGPRGSASTLVLGLLFTVVGGAQLFQVITGREVWDYLWRLWPVLLIVMGTKILIDHYSRVRS